MTSSRVLRVAGGALACGAVVVLGACGSSSSGSSSSSGAASSAAASGSGSASASASKPAAAWSYSGANGPSDWGSLDTAYALCGSGTAQSPINIETAAAVSSPTLGTPAVKYSEAKSEVENNGHSIEAVPSTDTNAITVAGQSFSLKNVHFHAPSEHTIDGKSFPLELHFVNKTASGSGAVIGVLVNEGAQNDAWQPFIDAMAKTTKDTPSEAELPWQSMAPTSFTAFNYAGSLTTPPCSQPINWWVDSTPITMSAAQIQAFTNQYTNNNRPVQPLDGRVVVSTGSN